MKLCVNKEFTPSCFLQWSKKILQKNAPSTAHLYEQTLNLPTPVEDRNANFCKLLMHFYQKLSVSNIILCTATYASNWALWWNPTALCGVKGWVALKKPSIKHCSTSSCVVCCVCVCVRSLEGGIGIGSSMTRTLAGNKVEPVLTSVAAEVCVFVFFLGGLGERAEGWTQGLSLTWTGISTRISCTLSVYTKLQASLCLSFVLRVPKFKQCVNLQRNKTNEIYFSKVNAYMARVRTPLNLAVLWTGKEASELSYAWPTWLWSQFRHLKVS